MLLLSDPGSDSNEGVLRIPQSSIITENSPSDCLVSHLGHSLGGVLPLCKEVVGVFFSPIWQGKDLSGTTIVVKVELVVIAMKEYSTFPKFLSIDTEDLNSLIRKFELKINPVHGWVTYIIKSICLLHLYSS